MTTRKLQWRRTTEFTRANQPVGIPIIIIEIYKEHRQACQHSHELTGIDSIGRDLEWRVRMIRRTLL